MPHAHSRAFRAFKYAIYALLAANVYWFFAGEVTAARVQFPGGVAPGDLIEAYAATVDTAAWVGLLLLFELETGVLAERRLTPTVTRALHGLRAACYLVIVYAFAGYIANRAALDAATLLPGITDLCALAGADWTFALGLDDYAAITADNCGSLPGAGPFLQLGGLRIALDAAGLEAIRALAWLDVLNAGAWLLVVAILELDVWLQERHRYAGAALKASIAAKAVLYPSLLYTAAYWGLHGDFIDFWDAFLWLVAFAFIELNLFRWLADTRRSTVA